MLQAGPSPPNQNLHGSLEWIFQGLTLFLPPNQQCQLTARNSKHNQEQGSTVADKLARRDAAQRMCCSVQTNKVDAQCDKLATELSRQCFALKVANLHLTHLHLTYPTCIWRLRWRWPHLSFAELFGIRKQGYLRYRVALFAWSYV